MSQRINGAFLNGIPFTHLQAGDAYLLTTSTRRNLCRNVLISQIEEAGDGDDSVGGGQSEENIQAEAVTSRRALPLP